MNEMAVVEYLLKKFAEYRAKKDYHQKRLDTFMCSEYDDKMKSIREIVKERFGMTISEAKTEYFAYNSVCSVRVRKEIQNENQSN